MLPTGYAGFLPGKAYAASNMFWITIKGKSTHAAHPHLGVDAVAVSAQVISALQLYASRNTDPLDSVVISICTMQSSSAQRNIISDEVRLGGVIRTLGPEMRQKTVAAVRKITNGVTEALGAEADIEIIEGHSGIVNNDMMTAFAEETARELLGAQHIVHLEKPTMGSEDFGLFLDQAPGCFFAMGTGNLQKGITAPGHNNMFDIDEDALPVLSALHAVLACNWLLTQRGNN